MIKIYFSNAHSICLQKSSQSLSNPISDNKIAFDLEFCFKHNRSILNDLILSLLSSILEH